MITCHCLIIVSLIIPLPYIRGESQRDSVATIGKEQLHVWQTRTSPRRPETGISSTGSIPTRKRNTTIHHRQHSLSNAHGILNIIGWGTMLPVGAVTARNFRKHPMMCDGWFRFHVCCQSAGYVLGAIGWFTGLLLISFVKKQFGSKSHGVLGTIIFILTTIQMLGMCWQPKKEHKCRKWWDRFHRVLGYALICLIITNIFVGMNRQKRWMWAYAGILGVLSIAAVALEVIRWNKSYDSSPTPHFNNNVHVYPSPH